MAKAAPVKPAGQREADLYSLVDQRYEGNLTPFYKDVARLVEDGKWTTEKSAFYRIVRGQPGRTNKARLRLYATVLGIAPKPFLQAWEEHEEEVGDTALPARLSPGEVRALFLRLIDRIDGLVDRVEDLERRVPAKRRRGGTP